MIEMIIVTMITMMMTMTMMMMMIIMIVIRPGKKIEKTVEGQNTGCAYCYRGTGDNPKRLVGHLKSIGVNLDVAQIQKSAS